MTVVTKTGATGVPANQPKASEFGEKSMQAALFGTLFRLGQTMKSLGVRALNDVALLQQRVQEQAICIQDLQKGIKVAAPVHSEAASEARPPAAVSGVSSASSSSATTTSCASTTSSQVEALSSKEERAPSGSPRDSLEQQLKNLEKDESVKPLATEDVYFRAATYSFFLNNTLSEDILDHVHRIIIKATQDLEKQTATLQQLQGRVTELKS